MASDPTPRPLRAPLVPEGYSRVAGTSPGRWSYPLKGLLKRRDSSLKANSLRWVESRATYKCASASQTAGVRRCLYGTHEETQCRLPETIGVEESEEAVDTGLEHRDGDAREITSSGGMAGEAADATELTELQAQNEELVITNDQLTVTNNGLTVQVSELEREVSRLNEDWKRENERVNEIWRMNCAQLSGFDEAITAKDPEISRLQAKIAELGASRTAPLDAVLTPVITARISDVTPRDRDSVVTPSARASGVTLTPPRTSSGGSDVVPVVSAPTHARRGKAPPISEFTGVDPDCTRDDWLPSLERASTWNSWTDEEKLKQLAGHRALQEWNLLLSADRASCSLAMEALRLRLDSCSKAVAAQDFRHTMQRDGESVADFIRCLEPTFRVAYGREPMLSETRDMLLYVQLQEGLRLQLMKGPAVSGAKDYQELCITTKNEEKCLANLQRRQEYAQTTRPGVQHNRQIQSFADQQQPKHRIPVFQPTSQLHRQPTCLLQVLHHQWSLEPTGSVTIAGGLDILFTSANYTRRKNLRVVVPVILPLPSRLLQTRMLRPR